MPFSEAHYRAARSSAVALDRSGRARIVLNGQDRRTFLHALLTNDIAGLRPGTGCYAAFLTPQGRMIADMRVFDLGDVLLLDLHRATRDDVLARLDQLIFSEDVQLGDVTDAFGCISVQGPEAAAVVAAILGADAGQVRAWTAHENARFEPGGDAVIAARVDEFALPGYLLFAGTDAVPRLIRAAADGGCAMADAETADVLRVEAGIPEFLVDMTADTIPLEAGIEGRAISFAKGCFPGQEVVVRIRDRGHGKVARRLAGLVITADAVPDRGAVVRARGRDSGRITSAVLSPALGQPIALGYVAREDAEPGTQVTVAHGETELPAEVRQLPFVG